MQDEWAPYLEGFLHEYKKGICFALFYILSPKSRGKAHKSHPLRDYTLLKAYDPGLMESRAVKGRGYRKETSLPGIILADTLAPFSALQAVSLQESCRISDC